MTKQKKQRRSKGFSESSRVKVERAKKKDRVNKDAQCTFDPVVKIDNPGKIDVEQELKILRDKGMRGRDLELAQVFFESHNKGRNPVCYSLGFDNNGREIVMYSM